MLHNEDIAPNPIPLAPAITKPSPFCMQQQCVLCEKKIHHQGFGKMKHDIDAQRQLMLGVEYLDHRIQHAFNTADNDVCNGVENIENVRAKTIHNNFA